MKHALFVGLNGNPEFCCAEMTTGAKLKKNSCVKVL
jgi:hypothetical protein